MGVGDILNKLEKVSRSGGGWVACCPAHLDVKPSLSIGEGRDGKVLLKCHAGCSYEQVLSSINLNTCSNNKNTERTRRVEAIYDYLDEAGDLLFQVIRYEPKGFSQRRPDATGKYSYDLNGVRRVLYYLPELLEADPQVMVFVVEGERDADRLMAAGVLATTNAGGAGKWLDEYNEVLRGRQVCIIPDNDSVGHKHAEKVAYALYGVASSLRVLYLPNMPDKGDVSDWLNAGGSIQELYSLVNSTPDWTPNIAIQKDSARDEDKNTREWRGQRKSQAKILIELAEDSELFHTTEGEAYATVSVNGHKETWPFKSRGFHDWLKHRYYEAEGGAPSALAFQNALGVLQGRARYSGGAYEVYTRIAEYEGSIIIDLCDEQWRAVRVTGDCWEIITVAPVKFRRAKGMLSLPMPTRGGDVEQLRRLINISPRDWPLILGWLVAAYRPNRPFPLLALHGEQGSAKSTLARMLRALVDPNKAALRSEPRDCRDLMIAAVNGWLISLDNLSHIPSWLSDALCRLTTGGGFATRELYANDEEALFDAMRPVLLNGIEELATRSDLLDRSIVLNLPAIPEHRRRTEIEVWQDFESAMPTVFGALLNGVSAALRNINNVKLEKKPRMADFAQWAVAAESSFGMEPGTFIRAYSVNRATANELALDASPIAAAVTALIRTQGHFEGTASELLKQLNEIIGEEGHRQQGWPKRANILSGMLKRLAPNLRVAGVTVTLDRTKQGSRVLIDSMTGSSSSSSPATENRAKLSCLEEDDNKAGNNNAT
jgi:hypothetical protein